MRIRPYRKTDASYIREWIADEKVHAMWSAGKLPYGFLENDLENLLAEAEAGYNQSAFTAVLDDGTPVGSFCMGRQSLWCSKKRQCGRNKCKDYKCCKKSKDEQPW